MKRTEDWVSLPPDFPPLGKTGQTTASSTTPLIPQYLLSVPPNANQTMVDLSNSLLYALCRPWGDAAENISDQQVQRRIFERDQAKERQGQTEKSFSWDTTALGLKAPLDEKPSWFLDCDRPSGWEAAADVEVYDDEELGIVEKVVSANPECP